MSSTEIEQTYLLAFKHQNSLHALELLEPMLTHSPETYEHTIRVCLLSYAFGLYLGLSGKQLELIFDAALLHDIGKLKIPTEILNKSEKLTPFERQIKNQHVQYSYMVSKQKPSLGYASIIGSLHHERWDGNGYPLRLKGSEIPYEAQIISLSDKWDTMTSPHTNREEMSEENALSALFSERDKGRFNTELLDQFICFIDAFLYE